MNRREFVSGMLAAPAVAASWDVQTQKQRRQQIYTLHQAMVGPLFDDAGRWIGKSTAPGGRECLWNCLSFLKGAATHAKGNAIIARTFEERSRFNAFSHFEFVTSTQLLVRDGGELTASNRDLLRGLVREALARKSQIRFMGYNDNFPAMENEVATIGGELLDDASARERGLEGMHRLLELLGRRGLLSEYTSSTYCPVTMLCYSDIAEYSKDTQARQLALEIERKVWMDMAAHFHPPTNILAGPHSRAYVVDSVGHLHQIHMLIYQAFGDRLWLNPVRFMFPPVSGQVIHHDGDVPFLQVSTAWITSGTYHPTAEIERLLFAKTLPMRVTATSEFGCSAEFVGVRNTGPNGQPVKTTEVLEYPAGEMVSTTYLTEDYAVGSASAPFLDGNQTDTFFVNFRRSAKPDSLKDTSTIFARYTVDDFAPGKPWTDPRNPGREVTRSLLGESGRVRTAQKDGTVLVAYQSKGQFIGEYRGLRLSIAIPTIYRGMRRILVKGAEVKLPFHSATPETVWIEDDFLYAAFQPMKLTNHGREDALRIQESDGYLSIHLVNYEGPGRNFTRRELLNTLNGFIAEIGGVKEHGAFGTFQQKVSAGKIGDEVIAAQRVVSYERAGVRLELCHSLAYDGLKYVLIDGKPQPRPAFQIS